jgi:hypothetical protein
MLTQTRQSKFSSPVNKSRSEEKLNWKVPNWLLIERAET